MKENIWGKDIPSIKVSKKTIQGFGYTMKVNGMNQLTNAYGEVEGVTTEEAVLLKKDVFTRTIVRIGKENADVYQMLAKNGDFLTFVFFPATSKFSNVVFEHHNKSGKEEYCRIYTEADLNDMQQKAPSHELLTSMEKLVSVFEQKDAGTLELPEPPKEFE